MNDMSKAQTF